ncbi:MAG: TetR family transcriptional regulator C-terminal domain-containing protein [Cellvibrionales bacterium]|nr:TetR family transcriptional regulator C-terminal domain-containing protein [Cellvibrionales bacterium]
MVQRKRNTPKKYKPGKIREQNYARILDAAEALFATHGFKGTSMMQIAERVNLPKANVHYYFKSKSLLYAKVLERIIDTWNQGLEDIKAEDDPKTVLSAYIAAKVQNACEKPLPSRLFATEIITGAPYLKDYIKEDMREWIKEKTTVFNQWIAAGKLKPVDPVRLIFLIWASTQHYADFETQVLLLTNRQEYDDEEITKTQQFLTTIILDALIPSYSENNTPKGMIDNPVTFDKTLLAV